MLPVIELVEDAVRKNARRWREHAGVPVWAVLKADGYGWGARRLVEILDAEVEGFFVADAGEARAIRPLTRKPIAIFAASAAEEVAALLDDAVLPNVASIEALRAADEWSHERRRRARIRVGIVPAAGWSGLLPGAVEPFARVAAGAAVDLELWTHLTAPDLRDRQRARFAEAKSMLEGAGARVVATDVASTFISSDEGRSADSRVRIGIGLFGGRQASGPALPCAIRIAAPVVDSLPSAAVESAGYREAGTSGEPWLAVVRCGYSDGLPARLAGTNKIVSVGMQYTVLARKGRQQIGDFLRILDTSSDLCTFLAGTGMSPHEFVVGLKEGPGRVDMVIEKR